MWSENKERVDFMKGLLREGLIFKGGCLFTGAGTAGRPAEKVVEEGSRGSN